MKNLIQKEIKRLKSLGASYVDIRVHVKDVTERFSSCDGLLENHLLEKRFGLGVRVLFNGAFGFCSVEDIDQLSLASDFALNQAKNSTQLIQTPVELISKQIFQDHYKTPTEIYPSDVPIKEKINKLLELALPLKDKEFLHYGSNLGFYEREILYLDSEGTEITKHIVDVEARLYTNALDKENLLQERTFNLYQNPALSVGFENLNNKEQIDHGDRLKKELKQLLHAPLCEKETCDVILLNEMMALQTHETIGHALELDRILGYELSFAGGSHVSLTDLGKLQFGSSKLNSFSDGTTSCSPGTHGYDDEGVKGKQVQLIKDGVLQNTISSRQMVVEANQKMNRDYFKESGGACRAQSYNKPPIDRMNNINVAFGNDGSLEDMIQKTQNGMILESPRSWSIGSNRENFHFSCEIGFKIKEGKIDHIVRNPTYRGDSLPFWNSLDLVGGAETWQLQQVFQCGKGSTEPDHASRPWRSCVSILQCRSGLLMELYNKLLISLNTHIRSLDIEGSVNYKYEDARLVRCGRNQISVNTKQMGGSLTINLRMDKKSMSRKFSGVIFVLNDLIKEINEMFEILPLMPVIDYLKDLSVKNSGQGVFDYRDPKMIEDKSSEMVLFFKEVKEILPDPSLELSGSFSLGSSGFNYIDVTMDTPVSHQSSDFSVEAVIQMGEHDNKELRVSQTGDRWEQFDSDYLINKLIESIEIKKSTKRINIEPGKYNIIFSHEALSEMAVYMSYISLYGESLLYKTGMLDEKKHPTGTKIFDSKFSMTDDPNDPDIILKRMVTPTGLNREVFPLIEQGVLKNIYYSDKNTCDKFNKELNNDFDCANFKIAGGDGPSNLADIIAQTTKPTIYISFIHYMNFTNQTKGEFTGTSRFGTLLIEDGKIKNHLYNLRINDNYFKIFNNIEWLSKELAHTSMASSYGLRWPFACTSPKYTLIRDVNISGSSFQK